MGNRKVISREKASEEIASYLTSENIQASTNSQAKMTKLNKYLGVLNRQIQFYKLPPPEGSKKPNKYFARINAGGNAYYFPYNKSASDLKHLIATALYNSDRVQSDELKKAIQDTMKGSTPAQPTSVTDEGLIAITHPFGHQTGHSSSSDYMSEDSDSDSDASETPKAGPSGASGISRVPISGAKKRSEPSATTTESDSAMQVDKQPQTTGTAIKRSKGKGKKDLLQQQMITSKGDDLLTETQTATVEGQKGAVETQEVATPENLLPEQTALATMDGNDPAGGAQEATQPLLGAGPLVVSGAGALVPRGPMELEGRTDEPPRMEVMEPVFIPIMDGSSSTAVVPKSAYDPKHYVPSSVPLESIDTQRAQQHFYAQFNQNNQMFSQVNNDNSVNVTNNITMTYNTVNNQFNDTRTQILNQGVDGVQLDTALRALQIEMRNQGMSMAQMQYAQVMFMQQNAQQMNNLLMSNAQAIQEAMSRAIQGASDMEISDGLPSSPDSSSSGGSDSTDGSSPPATPINASGDTSIGQPVNASGATQTPSSNTGGGSEYLLRQILEILTIQNADKLRAMALAKNVDQYTPKSSAPVNLPKPLVLPREDARGRQIIDSDYVVIRPRWG